MTQPIARPLGELIREATDIADVHALLATGETYLDATQRTKNRWKRIATKRIAELKMESVR